MHNFHTASNSLISSSTVLSLFGLRALSVGLEVGEDVDGEKQGEMGAACLYLISDFSSVHSWIMDSEAEELVSLFSISALFGLWEARAAMKKYHKVGGLNNRNLSPSPGG